MQVECLPKEGKWEVFTLYLDGDDWREIHTAIFGKKPRVKLQADTPEDFAVEFEALELSKAKRYTLNRLVMKNYASFELRKLLQERLVSPLNIEKVIEECVALGYINDQDWVNGFVRRNLQRHVGPKMIAMKLKAKGVPVELIDSSLEESRSSDRQQEQIQHLLETKFRSRDLARPAEKQKVIAALLRKGFEFGEIQQGLERVTRFMEKL